MAGDRDLADMAEREGAVADSRAPVTAASTSRAFGPISDNVPKSSVTSVSFASSPSPICSPIQARSCVRKPVPVTM